MVSRCAFKNKQQIVFCDKSCIGGWTPSQLITPLEILSRLSLFQSLYFSGKNCPYIIFDKKYINRLPSDSFLGPFSPRKMFHFWTFCPRKICHFWTQKYIANLFKKNSFGTKLDLNQPKTRGKCLLIEPNRFFSKRFRKDSSDNGLISNKMTNICFFMFG